MASIEKKELSGQQVTFVVPTRFDRQEPCECPAGGHPNWVQPIVVGREHFEPGKTYTVSADIANKIQTVLMEKEREGFEYVDVPKADMWGYKFASGVIRINKDSFVAGHSHKVPKNLVAELKDIIAKRHAHDLNLASKDINIEAIQQLQGAADSLSRAASGGTMPIITSPAALANQISNLAITR